MDIIPDGFANDVSSSTSAFMVDVAPFLTLILGVLLAALVISIIIGAIKR